MPMWLWNTNNGVPCETMPFNFKVPESILICNIKIIYLSVQVYVG